MHPTRRSTRRTASVQDENKIYESRVTRSKTAAPSSTNNSNNTHHALAKKTSSLASTSSSSLNAKRPALGDLSNINARPQQPPLGKKPAVVATRQQPPSKENIPPHQSRKADLVHGRSNSSTSLDALEGEAHVAKKIKSDEKPKDEYEYWEDLDAEDLDDPLMVSEYVDEIFDYMSILEIKTMANPNYIKYQDFEWRVREILVDWLVEVHTKFRLLPETLFLAVNVVDRFLSLERVAVDMVQLVGITALFIAAKYEEVFSPSIQNFVYVTDKAYEESQILDMEITILNKLKFDLSYPNPMSFLRRSSKADNYDIQTRTVAKYLLEIGLLDHEFLQFIPSCVAATAMYLARIILDRDDWDGTLAHYSGGYTPAMMCKARQSMVKYLIAPVKHDAFFKKYASKRFLKASILCRAWAHNKYTKAYQDGIFDAEYKNNPDNNLRKAEETTLRKLLLVNNSSTK